MKNKKNAFSLVELSIVLIIIGLLVAAVTTGQSLIKAAQIQKTLTTIAEIKTQMKTFQLTYEGLAGDITNASEFFPDAPNVNDTNGDGDGRIDTAAESRSVWFLLFHAELTSVEYVSTANPPTTILSGAGSHFPTAKGFFGAANYHTGEIEDFYTDEIFYRNNMPYPDAYSLSGYAIKICSVNNTFNYHHSSASSIQSYTMDRKIDDGIANTGKMVTYNGQTGIACLDSSTSTLYDLHDQEACQPTFR